MNGTRSQMYVRNIVFGVSDSLVSTVGLLSGIDVNGTARHTIIITGIVYAFVESFSMAVGSFLSESSAEDFAARRDVPIGRPFVGGIVMFVSFILASFVPIAPYLLVDTGMALWASIGLSVAALFVVGYASARMSKTHMLRHGLRMALLGGIAIVVGIVVGKVVDGNQV